MAKKSKNKKSKPVASPSAYQAEVEDLLRENAAAIHASDKAKSR